MNNVMETGYRNTQIDWNVTKRTVNSQNSYQSALAAAVAGTKKENGRNDVKKGSVVDDYKRKNPDDASHVDNQVNAGKKVISRNGAENVSREEMTMEEYKHFFYGLMDSIPFDSTRMNDREVVNISEKGWEQMKNDPDYEAWVLGYTVENRSVHNPFPGASPSFCIENFGASIEEHRGEGVPMNGLNGNHKKAEDDEETWWQKRHRKIEELIEESAKRPQAEAQIQSAPESHVYFGGQLKNGLRIRDILTESFQTGGEFMADL